jgi:hypothetical protein
MKRDPDWERTGTIVAYAEWLRKKSDAFAVLVIRRDDAALAADERIAPADVQERMEEYIGALCDDLAKARFEQRKAARVEYGPLRE